VSEVADDPAVNPYAAPAAELQHAPAAEASQRAAFYAMSPRKAAVMSFLTMSIYELCFWWRHWRTRREGGEDVNVFWRTAFAAFYAYPFKNTVSVGLAQHGAPLHWLLNAMPTLYMLSYLIDNALARLESQHWIWFALSVSMNVLRSLLLAVLQKSVNQVLEANGYRGPVNRGATVRTYLMAALGLLIWVSTIAAFLFPETNQDAA